MKYWSETQPAREHRQRVNGVLGLGQVYICGDRCFRRRNSVLAIIFLVAFLQEGHSGPVWVVQPFCALTDGAEGLPQMARNSLIGRVYGSGVTCSS